MPRRRNDDHPEPRHDYGTLIMLVLLVLAVLVFLTFELWLPHPAQHR